jgi:prepilin-type processing-associated H-X9-DG protein
VKNPSSLVYLMDARWVDLRGSTDPSWQARIGRARYRHRAASRPNDTTLSGGLNVTFSDGHASFIDAETIMKYPKSPDGRVIWDPNYQ